MIATSNLVVSREFAVSAKMSEEEMLVDLAAHLYATKKLTMGQAKRMAGLDQIAFQKTNLLIIGRINCFPTYSKRS